MCGLRAAASPPRSCSVSSSPPPSPPPPSPTASSYNQPMKKDFDGWNKVIQWPSQGTVSGRTGAVPRMLRGVWCLTCNIDAEPSALSCAKINSTRAPSPLVKFGSNKQGGRTKPKITSFFEVILASHTYAF